MWSARIFDWAAKAFVAFICTVMFINIASLLAIEKIDLFSIDSPLLFAFLIAVTILICFIITVYKDYKAGKASKKMQEDSSAEIIDELARVMFFIAGVYLYSLVVKYMHFIFGSIVFLTIGMIWLNEYKVKIGTKLVKAVIACIITVPILYYVFHGVFNVMLP